jgi:hypothetical protein
MEKTVSKSFRLPQADVSWIQLMAKNSGITQTEIVSKCIENAKLTEGKAMSATATGKVGSITEDNEALKVLGQLGIATASGIAGYHIAGYIRKQFDMDEDKGTQLLVGMISGLVPFLIMAFRSED